MFHHMLAHLLPTIVHSRRGRFIGRQLRRTSLPRWYLWLRGGASLCLCALCALFLRQSTLVCLWLFRSRTATQLTHLACTVDRLARRCNPLATRTMCGKGWQQVVAPRAALRITIGSAIICFVRVCMVPNRRETTGHARDAVDLLAMV